MSEVGKFIKYGYSAWVSPAFRGNKYLIVTVESGWIYFFTDADVDGDGTKYSVDTLEFNDGKRFTIEEQNE